MHSLVEELLSSKGIAQDCPLRRGARGERIWPEGYVGSTSNKGAVVIGALADRSVLAGVGIDVELIQPTQGDLPRTVEEGERPPVRDNHLSLLGGFSAKEAAYKAFYPMEKVVLDFQDIQLVWHSEAEGTIRGVAHCPSDIRLTVRFRHSQGWVVCVALTRT